MTNEVTYLIDVMVANPKTRIGTAKTFVQWNIETQCFDGWQEGTLLWSIEFGDRDPLDVERDVAMKLWQAIS